MARVNRTINTLSLAAGGSGLSANVNCQGAIRVNISVTADTNVVLTTGDIKVTMPDGKIVTITPVAYPTGSADATTHELDAAGVITGVALNGSTHVETSLRAAGDAGANSKYGVLNGADYVQLSLARGAGATTLYTIITTCYYD